MAATQETQSTQQRLDPRRLGRNNSGLTAQDVSDVVCVLHPSSETAIRIVAYTARNNPQHVLQNQNIAGLTDEHGQLIAESEQDTILLRSQTSNRPLDLALRFSSHVSDPTMGFCFGRNQVKCDIVLDPEEHNRRVSNVHFHIFLNENGVLMLEDVSTNGTIVNGGQLGGKRRPQKPSARMLESGSIIEILNSSPEDAIKFILRIPPRDNLFDDYQANFRAYMNHVQVARERAENAKNGGLKLTDAATRRVLAAPLAGPVNSKVIPAPSVPKLSNYGMHWDGGGRYNCIGLLGKGAFATVYQIATVYEGNLFAAKELDKKRFVKNGHLDARIDTEMTIMQEISHANIVKFVEYEETKNHLYLIMEFVPGGDLQGYIQSHATLPEDPARDMSRQILEALQYLHSQNITHRDIKPDNILIASEQPFVVKLTDFGLSKVVRNNETFLKTFCGTLLYCAPEVFPHYDNYVANKRPKRRRREPDNSKHTYGQSVDVWSFAAVLWTALCGKAPFEGVVDANGRGMFDRIMNNQLEKTPLLECGVSETACELLLMMLDTDPVSRPAETECLRHPWLNDGVWAEAPAGEVRDGIYDITEDLEGADDLGASQLSLHDDDDEEPEPSADSVGSDKMHPPKRPRAQPDPDETPRQGHCFENVPLVNATDTTGKQYPATMPEARPTKLFGEISQAALQSSGALGNITNADLYPPQNGSFNGSSNDSSYGDSAILHMEGVELSGPVGGGLGGGMGGGLDGEDQRPGAHTSLSGAESMVRELQMYSPRKGRSVAGTPERERPRTPPQDEANGSDGPQKSKLTASKTSQEITPKPKPRRAGPIDRQIQLPITASAYFDPYDVSTHNVEYASRVSGHDFAAQPTTTEAGVKSLPADVQASFHANSAGRRSMSSEAKQASSGAQEPPAPAPADCLARLVSTSDSFTPIAIPLTQRTTTWGRAPSCDQTYAPATDTRVPKVGLELVFDAPGIGDAERAGRDWTALAPLKLLALTRSTNGVWVNGVRLLEADGAGRRLYGRLAHGDVVDVYRPRGGTSQSSGGSAGNASEPVELGLSFRVEIYVSGAKWARRAGDRVFEPMSYQ